MIICLCIITVICLRQRANGWKRILAVILFGLYLIEVLNRVFFPIPIPLDWPANLSWNLALYTIKQVNLSPLYFVALVHFNSAWQWVVRDFLLNTFLTIPFGFGINWLFRPKLIKLFFWALLTGLALEGLQLILNVVLGVAYHTVDINDVIMNSLGVLIGYCFFFVFFRSTKSKPRIVEKTTSFEA